MYSAKQPRKTSKKIIKFMTEGSFTIIKYEIFKYLYTKTMFNDEFNHQNSESMFHFTFTCILSLYLSSSLIQSVSFKVAEPRWYQHEWARLDRSGTTLAQHTRLVLSYFVRECETGCLTMQKHFKRPPQCGSAFCIVALCAFTVSCAS